MNIFLKTLLLALCTTAQLFLFAQNNTISNDWCTDATTLQINALTGYSDTLSGSTLGADALGGNDCFPSAPDVWYSFTATATAHTLSVRNTYLVGYEPYQYAGYFVAAVYEGDCSQLQRRLCSPEATYIQGDMTFGDLTPGQVYFVRIASYYGNPMKFDIFIQTPPTFAANDACNQPINVSVNSGPVCDVLLTGTTLGATPSFLPQCVNCSNLLPSSNDVWYSFTATAATHIIAVSDIRMAPDSTQYSNLWMSLLQGNCDSLIAKDYARNLFYMGEMVATHLTIGQKYTIRIYDSSPNNAVKFDLCITTPLAPTNDECSQAVLLNPDSIHCNVASMQGTTIAAGGTLSDCTGTGAVTDVWYSFVAPEQVGRLSVHASSGPYYNFGYQLMKGNCDSLESVVCSDYTGNAPPAWYRLEVGATYYLRLFSRQESAHNFSFCINFIPTPANDSCIAAQEVLPNDSLLCEHIYTGTTQGALFEGTHTTPDVWYVFTATSNTHVFDFQGYPPGLLLQVYPEADCATLTDSTVYMAEYPAIVNVFQPNQRYLIRVYESGTFGARDFSFCIKTLPLSPPNETCAGAIELIPNIALECNTFVHGSTAGTIASDYQGCVAGNDIWYTFTATAHTHIVAAQNVQLAYGYGGLGASIEVYKGSACGDFTTLACQQLHAPVYLNNLVPGNTYFVKITSYFGFPFAFDLCLKTIPIPSNNLCSDAILLDVSPDAVCQNTITGTTQGATRDALSASCDMGHADVWYRFVTTQSAHRIAIRDISDPNGEGAYCNVSIYSGDCNDLQLLTCLSYINSDYTFKIGDFQPASVYYIRVSGMTNTGSNFSICVGTPEPPAPNDACWTATEVPVSPTDSCIYKVHADTYNSTPSTPLDYTDPAWGQRDIWFSFVATATTHIIRPDSIVYSGGFLVLRAWRGYCDSLANIAYYVSYESNQMLLTHLIPGETYYISAADAYGGWISFDLCITTPAVPANDLCTDAIELPENTDLTCQITTDGTTLGATGILPNCEGNLSNDVWYRFTATGTQYYLQVNAIDQQNYALYEVYAGHCDSLVSIKACNIGQNILPGLTVGSTYYVKVLAPQNEIRQFNICLRRLPEPPINDHCAGAISIVSNSDGNCQQIYEGSTVGATQSYTSCYDYPTHDVWYSFVAESSQHSVQLQPNGTSISPGYYPFVVRLLSGSPCDSVVALQCTEGILNDQLVFWDSLVPGQTYYILIGSYFDYPQNFTLCIRNIGQEPANIKCEDALDAVVNPNMNCTEVTSGTTSGLNNMRYGNCLVGVGLWYKFVPTQEAYIFQLKNIFTHYGNTNIGLELYWGTCDNMNYIGCAQDTASLLERHLTPGVEHFIRVTGAASSGTDFDLCIQTVVPPVNDACEQATWVVPNIGLECIESVPGTTLGVDLSQNTYGDVWYRFTATSTTHVLNVYNIELIAGYYNFMSIEVYRDSCDALNSLGQFSASDIASYSNLVVGETYWVRVASAYSYHLHRFDFCITTAVTSPPNEFCDNAYEIVPNIGMDCIVSLNGTTAGSVSNETGSCFSGNDVWYKFVASSTSHIIQFSEINDWPYAVAAELGTADDCQNFNGIQCIYYGNTLYGNTLVPGQTYYIRVMEPGVPNFTYNICILTVPTPPNDACFDAQIIAASDSMQCDSVIYGTTFGATPSGTEGCVGDYNDVWYAFEATQTAHTIELSIGLSYYLELYRNTCDSLVMVTCRNNYSAMANVIGDLTVGAMYWIRIVPLGQNTDFYLCVYGAPPLPPNDNCTQATLVAVSPTDSCTTLVSGSFEHATPSNTGSTTLPVGNEQDIWYTFTATHQNINLQLSSSAYLPFYIQLYEGQCDSFQLLVDTYTYGPAYFTNLTIGETYYLRLWRYTNSGTFDLCLTPVPTPVNDECAGALPLEADTSLNCQINNYISNFGATASLPSCFGQAVNDVWYTFEATETSYRAALTSGYGILGFEIFEGQCDSLVLVVPCSEVDAQIFWVNDLVIGHKYYVRIQLMPTFVYANLCFSPIAPPPSNEQCEQAQWVIPSEGVDCTQTYNGTTLNAALSDTTCSGQPARSVWYKFVATDSTHVVKVEQTQFYFNSYSINIGLEIYKGGSCDSLTSIYCTSYAPQPITLTDLSAGDTCYLRLWSAQYEAFDFSLCIRTPSVPPNTICANALPVVPNIGAMCDTTTTGTTAGLTVVESFQCYGGTSMWYTFTAEENMVYTAHFSELTAIYGSQYLSLELYSGTCDSLVLIDCWNHIEASTLSPGQYFIRVAGRENAGTHFELCVRAFPVPTHDDCENAIAVPVSNGAECDSVIHGATYGATTSSSGSFWYCQAENDVWYSFVATQTVHYITVDNEDTQYAPNNIFWELLSGCEVWQHINCYPTGQTTTVSSLTPGNTYYIRVGSHSQSISYAFDLCITTPVPDLVPYTPQANLIACIPDTSGYLYGYINNYSEATIQAGNATYSMELTGAHTAQYGPDTVWTQINPGSSQFVIFEGIHWTNPGITYGKLIVHTPNDSDTSNDTFYFEVHNQPILDWHYDNDHDGFGDPNTFTQSCDSAYYASVGYVNNNSDCNDYDPLQYPGAPEICNGTDDDCDGLPDHQDPDLPNAFAIIAFKDVLLKANTVESGGVGVKEANKKVRLQTGTQITAAGTFVQAPILELTGGSAANTVYTQSVTAATPVFLGNSVPSSNSITIPNNSGTVTLALGSYGTIVAGINTTLVFSGQETVYIREFIVKDGATIVVEQNTALRIAKGMALAKNVQVNTGNNFNLSIFTGENTTIDRGCQVFANIYTLKDLVLAKAAAATPTRMYGLFVANNVNAADFVTWNQSPNQCPVQRLERSAIHSTMPDNLGEMRISPNPNNGQFSVSLPFLPTSEIMLLIVNATGQVVQQIPVAAGQSTCAVTTEHLPDGLYYVRVIGNETTPTLVAKWIKTE